MISNDWDNLTEVNFNFQRSSFSDNKVYRSKSTAKLSPKSVEWFRKAKTKVGEMWSDCSMSTAEVSRKQYPFVNFYLVLISSCWTSEIQFDGKVFSDWGKEVVPNSQIEKSMAEVAVVNALIVRKGYPCHSISLCDWRLVPPAWWCQSDSMLWI